MHAKFQASNLTGVGGEEGDGRTQDVTPDPFTKFMNSLLRFASEGINNLLQSVFLQFWVKITSINYNPSTFGIH